MAERTPSRNSFRPRACDNCRVRKIKCDKATPCSSCGALDIPCKTAGVATGVSEPQRAAPSQYENKIDAIQEQLLVIQQALRDVNQSASPAPTHPVPRPVPSADPVPPFEGQSSFHHESILAKDAAFSAVAGAQGRRLDDHVSAALSSLTHSLDRNTAVSQDDAARDKTSASPLSKEELLPVDLAVSVVKAVKAQPPFFLVSHSWRDLLQIEMLCQSLYFPLQPVPAGSVTLFHGLFFYIIRDYLHQGHPDLTHYNLAASVEFCERHFFDGLNSYEMMTAPTLEKVQALLIGIIKAQEEFDIQRCWTYLSLAFNMCQTLGFHRSSTLKDDESPAAEAKRHVFWSLYTIDKNISLNIGFSSHFQDHDIDADLFKPSNKPSQRPWDLMAIVTVEFAAIQGRVFDQLYSVGAMNETDDKRARAVQQLSLDLIAVRDRLVAIDVSSGLYADSLHGMAACADFIAYSVMTVIYRAQSRPTDAMAVSSQCYEAARLALDSHLKCFGFFRDRQTHKQMEYVNWILLYPSFAPFVIVFTHAIATSSSTDLSLLQDTVKSLDLIKGLSRGSMHLFAICEAFAKTAQVLVDARQTVTGLEHHQDGSLFIPATTDGPGNIALPDFPWPENTFDSSMNQEDISLFLNDFIGTGRSVMEMLNSNSLNDSFR
ncbi:transcription factor domain-containing protein [Aspergillus affinis]|uniref:transcription factor domain-containing protein n=1 Tax=Aspergillus affinis TaxID=1070780 RepID=UPI0022FEAE93|nr:C6 transcription factor [Aspergillus affinis]KAI9035861.1 C6 transcription factor [Aspergillus affinis]